MSRGRIGAGTNEVERGDDGDRVPSRPSVSTRPLLPLGVERTGDLVRKAAAGDEHRWVELVGRFGPLAPRVTLRTGLNAADAADVGQATWMQLLGRIDQVCDPERVGARLATTARRQSHRVAMAECRVTLAGSSLSEAVPMPSAGDDVELTILCCHYDPAVERALRGLPVLQRKVICSATARSPPSALPISDTTPRLVTARSSLVVWVIKMKGKKNVISH